MAGDTLTIEQVVELRGRTERIAQLLHDQLRAHLETLRPLLAPRRVFGTHVPSSVSEDITGADQALARLREMYAQVCERPFSLRPELGERPLDLLENRLELYPWQYTYQARSERETKKVTITSPLRWVLTYGSTYSLQDLREALQSGKPRAEHVRQFLLSALAMHLLMERFAGLAALLVDLRYAVESERAPELGALPLLTISSYLPSFRPADDVVLAATRLSGVPAFIELIDVDALHALPDPLRTRIEGMLG